MHVFVPLCIQPLHSTATGTVTSNGYTLRLNPPLYPSLHHTATSCRYTPRYIIKNPAQTVTSPLPSTLACYRYMLPLRLTVSFYRYIYRYTLPLHPTVTPPPPYYPPLHLSLYLTAASYRCIPRFLIQIHITVTSTATSYRYHLPFSHLPSHIIPLHPTACIPTFHSTVTFFIVTPPFPFTVTPCRYSLPVHSTATEPTTVTCYRYTPHRQAPTRSPVVKHGCRIHSRHSVHSLASSQAGTAYRGPSTLTPQRLALGGTITVYVRPL